MKQKNAFTLLVILLLAVNTLPHAQKVIGISHATIIEPYCLQISFNKTTNLIFPYTIRSVDRGSRDILTQKAKGVDNVLMVKAGKENFEETNLSVITGDGELYSFILNYSNNPPLLNISFTKNAVNEIQSSWAGYNEALIQSTAKRVAKESRMINGIKNGRYKMLLRLNGLYVQHGVLFFQIEAQNSSNINYDVDGIRFFIRDEKRAKRTASQELELQPLYVYGDTTIIKSEAKDIMVFAFPLFTIPDKKYLSIQLMERNGGRHLNLKVHNKPVVKTKTISF